MKARTTRALLAICVVGLAVGAIPTTGQAGVGAGEFIVRCYWTGRSFNYDPILSPGNQSTAHTHDFYGNATTSYDSTDSSMEADTNSSCDDTKDRAGYWTPELLYNGSPWHPGNGAQAQPNQDLNIRAYYTGGASVQPIPDGSVMVAGYPSGCSSTSFTGCAAGNAWPQDFSRIFYYCGASPTVSTPQSYWPYDCSNYSAGGFTPDGAVMVLHFPDCWNGNADGVSPNGSGAVPQYIPNSVASGYTNDFKYENSDGTCPSNYPNPVTQLSIRIHTLQMNAGGGEPSGCASWNTQHPSDHHCVAASAPPANEAFGFSSALTGNPWYTFHSDYWQTWKQSKDVLDSQAGGTDTTRDIGTYDDAVEDCNNAGATCSFITNTNINPSDP